MEKSAISRINPDKILWVLTLTSVSGLRHLIDVEVVDEYRALYEKGLKDAGDIPKELISPKRTKFKSSSLEKIKRYHEDFLKIKDKYDALDAIERLKNPSTIEMKLLNEDFTESIKSLGGLTQSKNGNEKKYLKMINKYAFFWRRDGFYAYMLANAVAAVRVAGMLGYLSKEEMIIELDCIGSIISDRYDSYELFGRLASISHEFMGEAVFLKEMKKGITVMNIMLEEVYHTLWNFIPWGGKR